MKNFIKSEEGQGMVEYALILALVSIVAIAALRILGERVDQTYDKVNNNLNTANGVTAVSAESTEPAA